MAKHKHDWRKVGGTFLASGQSIVKKRCISCGEEKIEEMKQ
jgi:hypothetical protein